MKAKPCTTLREWLFRYWVGNRGGMWNYKCFFKGGGCKNVHWKDRKGFKPHYAGMLEKHEDPYWPFVKARGCLLKRKSVLLIISVGPHHTKHICQATVWMLVCAPCNSSGLFTWSTLKSQTGQDGFCQWTRESQFLHCLEWKCRPRNLRLI